MNLTAFKDPNITNLNRTCLGDYYAPLIKRVLIADGEGAEKHEQDANYEARLVAFSSHKSTI